MSGKAKTVAEFVFLRQTIVRSNFVLVQVISTLLTIYLLTMGIFIYTSGSSLFEHRERIDHSCHTETCEVTIRVDQDTVPGPLYLYIAFEGFFVNHRKVLYSVDYDQLGGATMTAEQLKSNCEGYSTIRDLKKFHPDIDITGHHEDDIVNPCGLFPFLYSKCELIR